MNYYCSIELSSHYLHQSVFLKNSIAVGTNIEVKNRLPANIGFDAIPIMISVVMSQIMIHSRRSLFVSATLFQKCVHYNRLKRRSTNRRRILKTDLGRQNIQQFSDD